MCFIMTRSQLPGILTLALSASLAPCSAQATELYGRLRLGPVYMVNDRPQGVDSSGFGLASDLDLGARLSPGFALHSSLFLHGSNWMAYDSAPSGTAHDHGTVVYGLGVGATANWRGVSLGLSTGAQFTHFPDPVDPSSLSAAGIGPFVRASVGYARDAGGALQLGVQGVGTYRVGKDQDDPRGYDLALLLSIALPSDAQSGSLPDTDAARASARGAMRSPGYSLSAQLGWWNAELELLSPVGVYAALGGPWVGALLSASEDRAIVPFGARLGYQLDWTEQWKLRAAAHLAGLYGSAGQCPDCSSHGSDSFLLFELGIRHQSSAGLVYGADVPLLVILDVLDLDQDTGDSGIFAPPLSLAFLQVYIGYSWLL
jgi:hypothetical protein